MRKKFTSSMSQIRDYWKNLMDSHHKKLSEGSEEITHLYSWPHKDAWRRMKKDKKQRGHTPNKHK